MVQSSGRARLATRLAVLGAALLLPVLLAAPPSRAGGPAPEYMVEDVNFYISGKDSPPLESMFPSINASGQVAGGGSAGILEPFHAYRANSTLTEQLDLGSLSPKFGRSNGFAINGAGEVAGVTDFFYGGNATANSSFFIISAFRYVDGKGMIGGAIEADYSAGLGINDAGTVVGEYSSYTAAQGGNPGFSRPFVWSVAEGAHPLPTSKLYGGIATDINNGDRIVGAVYGYYGEPYAAQWFRGKDGWLEPGPVPLPDVNSGNGVAHAVNEGGQVVGEYIPYSYYYELRGQRAGGFLFPGSRAFRYTPGDDDESIDLGLLPGGYSAAALAVNSSGMVVGTADRGYVKEGSAGAQSFESQRAFIWTESRGMRDLNDLIPQPTDWVLVSATGINDAGQIVGVGYEDGVPRVFRLSPAGAGMVSVTPVPVQFGELSVGNSRDREITVRNVGGGGPVSAGTGGGSGSVTITVLGAGGAFSVKRRTFTLAPGESRKIEVRFRPRRAGAFKNTVRFSTTNPSQPMLTVPVTGTACKKPFR